MKKYLAFAAILIILATGLFLRLNDLGWETYGYGEVEKRDVIVSYFNGNFVNNFYLFDNPFLGKYFFYLSAVVFGLTEIGLRSISIIFGMLTVFVVFIFTRKLYDTKTSMLSTSIVAFSILQIQFSRYAEWEIWLSFFFVLIAYLLWETTHENKRRAPWLLGLVLGIAFSIKFVSIIFLVAVIIYAIYIRHIKISIKPNFSISINNWILKSIIIAILVFLAAWPFGFARLHTETNVSVDYGNAVRSQTVEADIPIMLLSFSRRVFTSVGDSAEGVLAVPVFNYALLFIIKESLLMIPLLAAGLFFMFRKPMKGDALVLIFLLTFLVLLSFQRSSISYRHIVPVVPFFAVIASRWITHVKRQWLFISALSIVLFGYALLAGPSYALSFNPIKEAAGIPDSEFRFSEGMKETIGYLRENCDRTYASHFYRIMTEPYYESIHSEPPGDCVIKGNVNDRFDVDSYIAAENCTLARTISKDSIKLVEIYSC